MLLPTIFLCLGSLLAACGALNVASPMFVGSGRKEQLKNQIVLLANHSVIHLEIQLHLPPQKGTLITDQVGIFPLILL